MIKTITITECSCFKCDHVWRPTADRIPRLCPKCKSVTWNDDGDIISLTQTGNAAPVITRVEMTGDLARFGFESSPIEPSSDEFVDPLGPEDNTPFIEQERIIVPFED